MLRRNANAGEVWVYHDTPAPVVVRFDEKELATVREQGDDPRIPSALYQNLHTNLPHPLMAFRDRPFEEHVSLFPSHEEVASYLQRAANEFNSSITYQRKVLRIRHSSEVYDAKRWLVESIDTQTRETKEECFDSILCANGHYTVPSFPYIRGLASFTGRIDHSRSYRRPNAYIDEVCSLCLRKVS